MARPAEEKLHLYEKRKELIWALSYQGYSGADIAVIFNVNRSVTNRIIKECPDYWKPKWKKV